MRKTITHTNWFTLIRSSTVWHLRNNQLYLWLNLIVMGIEHNKTITVENIIQAPIDKVWRYWTDPTHIKNGTMRLMTGIHPLQKMI